ncbi:Biopolymer transport protein ExbB/TolQ [Sporobacter termitidis DSM 10068]|uniref:Biopolymer transport protein ExbB/TolQ n=1 Tax=Sporobacter termitidis DSM 10068 TaxID=1123282 RepID=A0A1M5XFA5_9FIRM|nr:MotA/TolQ/ExbB proton channel family protein [Sporobacter termitidis]SHH97903.1 Biopolymer transport protein ExbB/TolQ [Sporobacter termitidis DSM 10068]
MFSSANLSNALRAVASALQTPVTCVLLLMLAVTAVMVGAFIAELFTERLRLRVRLPELVDKIRSDGGTTGETIEKSGLLRRQKKALLELTRHAELTGPMREALAVRLIDEERGRYDALVRVTDVIARVGPMLGLLGTLIPLGPGIIALGRGDTYTLSTSFLTAFDSTVAGLVCAAVAFILSTVRKKWYANYMSMLELVMECVLEVENGEA